MSYWINRKILVEAKGQEIQHQKVWSKKFPYWQKEGKKTYSWLARKCNAFEDLLYSSKNKLAVEEEMLQINDLTKLLISIHNESNELLGEEPWLESNEWLDMVDEQILGFKRQEHRWLKRAEEEEHAMVYNGWKESIFKRSSSKSGRHSSQRNSSRTSGWRSMSGDFKTRAMEEKAKSTELLAEESFLMKIQIAQNESERLKVQETIAKARAKFFEESESGDGKLFSQTEETRPNK